MEDMEEEQEEMPELAAEILQVQLDATSRVTNFHASGDLLSGHKRSKAEKDDI